MDEKLNLDYYYGAEADQFSFIKVPELLIQDNRFSELSCAAILLYSIMLDRLGLSRKNGWMDKYGRAYICYSVSEAMDKINKSKPTAIKAIRELENIGLIERHKPGQGKPSIIYVKKIATLEEYPGVNENLPEVKKVVFKERDSFTSESKAAVDEPVNNYDLQKSTIFTTESKDFLAQEDKEVYPNQTNNKQTEYSHTDNQSYRPQKEGQIDSIDSRASKESMSNIIKRHIGYDRLLKDFPYDGERISEILRIMVKVICFAKMPYNINGCKIPAEIVKEQLLKLNQDHIEYVLSSLKKSSVPLTAPEAYIVASLYTAYDTIQNELCQRINYDQKVNYWSP